MICLKVNDPVNQQPYCNEHPDLLGDADIKLHGELFRLGRVTQAMRRETGERYSPRSKFGERLAAIFQALEERGYGPQWQQLAEHRTVDRQR